MIDIFIHFLRILFGLAITLFLPGFAVSLLLFKKELGILERVSLSCGLSILITILTSLLIDIVLGIDITFESISLSLLILTAISISIHNIQTKKIIRSHLKNTRLANRFLNLKRLLKNGGREK